MSNLYLTADLHLGHNNICKYRNQFASPEEHDAIIFDNLASAVTKRDTVFFLGDIAFDLESLDKIKSINVKSKVLILGNHDLERGVKMHHLIDTYDKIFSLHSRRNVWFSHCAIHPDEIRDRLGNIHGHSHNRAIDDGRYVCVSVEQTDYKPMLFSTAVSILKNQGR